MRSVLRTLLILVAVLGLDACTRGPDVPGLTADVQSRLDALYGHTVLAVDSLKRQGSAPYQAAADGAKQVIVYYNATLRFAEAYDPSDWEQLSPEILARALGATDSGIVGLKSGRIAAGGKLKVYGSVIYRRGADGWHATDLALPAKPVAGVETGLDAQARANELLSRLSKIAGGVGATRAQDGAIVNEELDRALQNIALRMDVGEHEVTVASGPEGGEYWNLVYALQPREKHEGLAIKVAATEGSVENARLVDAGQARFGIVQSDVAASAITGEGAFAANGPLLHLRAVAALFPEPLHIIVRADSGIDSVAGLAGRRVSIGSSGSGARQTVLRTMQQFGLDAGTFGKSVALAPAAALDRLAKGELDAVVTVVSAPWEQLLTATRDVPLKLLPLDTDTVARLHANIQGLVPLTIPAHTYPGQDEPVRTVAATALLVTNKAVPESLVTQVLDDLYSASAHTGSVTASRLSPDRALLGVSVPLHEGAALHFERRARGSAQ